VCIYTHTHIRTQKVHVWCLIHIVTLWLQPNSLGGNKRTPVPPQQHNIVHNTTVYTPCCTQAVILFLQHRQTLNYIYFLSQMHSHFTLCPYICFGSLSCILSRRNSRNQAAFVQQFLSNKTLSQPYSHSTFSKPVPTCLAIKELRSCRSANRQSK
jgi:hypothetical protein